MSAAEADLTKSAKKRMAKKAKEAAAKDQAEAEEAAKAAPPAPQPKAKGNAKAKAEAPAKAAAPKAAVAPKAASEPAKPAAKGKAKAEPKTEPKAAAKGAAKAVSKAAASPEPKAEPKAQPKAQAPATAKAEPKAKASGKAKAKGAAKPTEEVPAVKRDELPVNSFLDDGTGGAWDTIAKKQQKKQKGKGESQTEGKADEKAPVAAGKGRTETTTASGSKSKSIEQAKADVERILNMKKDEPAVPVATAHCDSIIVPEPMIGIVIGPKGQTIQAIQEKTKATRIDTSGGVFTISGEEEAVKEAKAAIQDIIEKGFCALFYENFTESAVSAHPQYFPDIIGPRGSIINEIKKNLKVEITIPTLPADKQESQKFKIKVAGEAKQVEEADRKSVV